MGDQDNQRSSSGFNDYVCRIADWSNDVSQFYNQLLDSMPEEMKQRLLTLKATEREFELIRSLEKRSIQGHVYDLILGLAKGRLSYRFNVYDLLSRDIEKEGTKKVLRSLSGKLLTDAYIEPMREE